MIKISSLRSYFKIYESEETRHVFEKNEREANRLSFVVLIFSAALLVISFILNTVGIFSVPDKTMRTLALQGSFEFAIPIVLYLIFRKKKCAWLKYVMVIGLMLVMMRLYSVLNHNVILIMVVPVILSSRYCSKGFTLLISILGAIAFAIASLSTAFYGIIDLNTVPAPEQGTVMVMEGSLRETVLRQGVDTAKLIRRTMIDSFLPRLLVYTMISVISVLIAKHGYQMVMDQNRIAKQSAAVAVELETATKIQNSMIPNIYPAFPDRKEFDIYASMDPAKEVGGDFYDFFLIDDDHLMIEIADVSGKGVPEATNASKELFTTDNMIDALNINPAEQPENILKTVKSEIDQFVQDAPQFDDITMLCLRYHGKAPNEEKEASA